MAQTTVATSRASTRVIVVVIGVALIVLMCHTTSGTDRVVPCLLSRRRPDNAGGCRFLHHGYDLARPAAEQYRCRAAGSGRLAPAHAPPPCPFRSPWHGSGIGCNGSEPASAHGAPPARRPRAQPTPASAGGSPPHAEPLPPFVSVART